MHLKMLISKESTTQFLKVLFSSRFDVNDLIRFTLTVRKNYRNVPYHNWDHAFSVAHAAYTVLKTTKNNFTPYEVSLINNLTAYHVKFSVTHAAYTVIEALTNKFTPYEVSFSVVHADYAVLKATKNIFTPYKVSCLIFLSFCSEYSD